jgi:Kdo2-lipid IVA lauroyltransferase/acyltransferase
MDTRENSQGVVLMKISPERQDRLIAAASAAFFQVAGRTPLSMGLVGGRLLGAAACRLLSRHRRITEANLKFAFRNEKSPAEIRRLVYRNFEQWGMIAFEWARWERMSRIRGGGFPYPVRARGLAHLQAARQKSEAVLLLSAHFGNWEYGHYYYGRHIHTLNFIVRRIDNPYLEACRLANNHCYGVNILYKEVGLKAAIKNLRKGQDLVIFADQKANPREGVAARFFGRRSTSIPLVASFAKKFQLPIVPMFVVRRGNTASHELTFLPELEYGPNEDVHAITQRQNDIIEKMIRRHPDHWLWMHRRWKTEYPEIYETN